MKERDFKRLAEAGRRLYEGGLVTGALGAIGARLPGGDMVVTAKGSRLGFLAGSDVLVLNGTGLPMNGKERSPAPDAKILRAILLAQPRSGCAIRVHSPYSTALAHIGRKGVERAHRLMEHLGGVAFVHYYRPGTAGLAGAVAEALRENRIAIIEKQGPVIWGTDIDDAVDIAEALESAAKVVFILGGTNGDGNA